jgi:hypothetical protein
MSKPTPKLNLDGWGLVDAEIIWNEGPLFKIKFIHFTECRREVFHYKEILNFNEIFIDKNLKIHEFRTE